MARDRHGSTTLYQKPIITENDEKGKSSAVAGGGGGGGQDTKVTSLRRLEAWGKGGGGEKPSDVLLWFINSRIVPWAGSTWELASDVHGFGFEVFLCYPLSRSYQITPIFGGLTK